MLKKETLAQLILDFQKGDLPKLIERELEVNLEIPLRRAIAILGPRRCGKTYYLYFLIKKLLKKGIKKQRILYINFEDPKLIDASLDDFIGFDEESHCTFFYKTGMFRIDVKGIYSSLDHESIERAIVGIYNDIKLKISNPVDLILFKLKFGSEQDYEDALAVYIRNKERIDHNFLKKKALKMEIKDELDSFLKRIATFLEKENSKNQQ